MADLIGRFLSFEEHLGRGLVKFAYYLILVFVVVAHVWWLFREIFLQFDLGDAVIVLCRFLLWVVVTRVVAELILAVLSIDDSLQNTATPGEGFEAGLTPSAASARADVPQAPATPPSTEDNGDDAAKSAD